LLNYAADISRMPPMTAGVSKSSGKTTEQCPVAGLSQLQLQLDFVSHLMRIGERLSHLPTKELRGTRDCKIHFNVSSARWATLSFAESKVSKYSPRPKVWT